jgi:hypothetical protein
MPTCSRPGGSESKARSIRARSLWVLASRQGRDRASCLPGSAFPPCRPCPQSKQLVRAAVWWVSASYIVVLEFGVCLGSGITCTVSAIVPDFLRSEDKDARQTTVYEVVILAQLGGDFFPSASLARVLPELLGPILRRQQPARRRAPAIPRQRRTVVCGMTPFPPFSFLAGITLPSSNPNKSWSD